MGKKMYEQNDNTSVRKPITLQFFTRKAPYQEEQQEMAKQGYNWDGKNWRYVGTISDAGGKPSADNRTATERNRDYWHPLKGARERVKASIENETNPYVGIKRTVLPAALAALGVLLLRGIPAGYRMWQLARSLPHGMQNLFTNLGIQTGAGFAGSAIGLKADELLGGTGELGAFAGGLGALWGINKIPFVQNLNTAVTTPYNMDRSGQKVYVRKTEDGTYEYTYNRETPKDVELSIKFSPSGRVLLYNWENKPATEIHLGGDKDGAPTRADLVHAGRFFKELAPGTYVTPDATATSQTLRILANGVFKEMFGKVLHEPLFNPPTVDGYTTALKMGKNHRIDWADNTFLTEFHPAFAKVDNIALYNAYNNFMANKSTANLQALNDVLISMGGKPALFINGELQIPFPLIHKLY